MTRIGLIADIHGNLIALQQVLAELAALQVDDIRCLGDVAVLGPQPDECIDLLRQRGIGTVCGNTDAWLVEGHTVPADPPESETSKQFVDWTRKRVSPENLAWLQSLPVFEVMKVGDVQVCLCHGSPVHSDAIIVNMGPERVGEFDFQVIVGGHTHQQTHTTIGQTNYMNPGSCGLPGVGPGEGIPIHLRPDWLQFSVIEDLGHEITVEMQQIPADIEQMLAAARATDMPEQEWWRSLWA